MMEDEEPVLELPARRTKKRSVARAYFFVSAIVFSFFLLIDIIALGAFGVIQKRVADFSSQLLPDSKCILFSQFGGLINENTIWLKLSNVSVCAFVLWGMVSLTFVALLWLIYSIVLTVLGLKM